MTKKQVSFLISFFLLLVLIASIVVGSEARADAPSAGDQQQGSSKGQSNSSDSAYQAYINDLESRTLPANYEQMKRTGQLDAQTMAATTNPAGDYAYQLDMDFSYTYWKTFSFSAGQNVVFETRKSTPTASDPIMYLFNIADPLTKGSWANDDAPGQGYQSKIACKIQYAGTYMLLLRAYSPSAPGTSDLYKDGVLIQSNAVLAGKVVRCSGISKSGELNYFTCRLTSGDTMMWLVDDIGDPNVTGLVRGYNDNYQGTGSFSWGKASRVKKSYPSYMPIGYAIVSSYSPTTTGRCDVYLKLDNSTANTSFPNLKPDDAIKTAPATDTYNCIAWSGGITNKWVWPPSQGSPWYNSNSLTAFDNFYGNKPARYTGAWTYTRTGAMASNSIVDLWYNPNFYGMGKGDFTHGSVRKPGNDQPHGYDWESKPGSLMRTLHPRRALLNNNQYGYGDVKYYYISTGKVASSLLSSEMDMQKDMTFEEAERAGLVVQEKVELTAPEESKLVNLIEKTPQGVRQEFDRKYQAWKATWGDLSYQSNPRSYAQSEEYKEFIDFCRMQGKTVWPLIFQYQAQGDFLITNAVDDLTLSEYGYLLNAIREDSRLEKYTDSGAYIAPSLEGNYLKYMKALLGLLQ